MSNFSMFLKENVTPVEEIEFVVSDRFKDADGEPIKWKLKAISSKVESAIRDECTKFNPKKGTSDFDSSKYNAKVCASTVVFPNLKDAELQDNYGVRGEVELLQEMLTGGEFIGLVRKVTDISIPDEVTEEMIDEAKNS